VKALVLSYRGLKISEGSFLTKIKIQCAAEYRYTINSTITAAMGMSRLCWLHVLLEWA